MGQGEVRGQRVNGVQGVKGQRSPTSIGEVVGVNHDRLPHIAIGSYRGGEGEEIYGAAQPYKCLPCPITEPPAP